MKVGFVSLGCPKNLVDSEVMLGHLRLKGYQITSKMDEAHILVVNTCSFIEDAKRESLDAIFEAASMKKEGVCERLIVAGCMVERYRETLLKEIPEIDACLGTRDIEKIAEVIGGSGWGELDRNPSYLYDEHSPRLLTTPKATAYLKISEGCDHSCAFCIIPAIRGGQRSRSVESVVNEARQLVDQGVLEICLVAQDTTDYGRDFGQPEALATLIRELGKVQGLQWFRIHYAYPNRLSDEMIRAIAETHNCAKYLDMPLQHASSQLLKKMSRGGSSENFGRLIRKIRAACPEIYLRSNFIVGFPGETEADFDELKSFILAMQFDHVGVFTYSQEEGTPAFTLGDPIPLSEKLRRKNQILSLQQDIARSKNQHKIGKTLKVFIEGAHEETPMIFKGRHEGQSPDIDGNVLIVDGDPQPQTFQWVKILEAHAYDLVGEIREGGLESTIEDYEKNYRNQP
ncbi:MAG: 30S ribosomal protein S12 methylthiotransferase RimO [Holophagaceae bacterium]